MSPLQRYNIGSIMRNYFSHLQVQLNMYTHKSHALYQLHCRQWRSKCYFIFNSYFLFCLFFIVVFIYVLIYIGTVRPSFALNIPAHVTSFRFFKRIL